MKEETTLIHFLSQDIHHEKENKENIVKKNLVNQEKDYQNQKKKPENNHKVDELSSKLEIGWNRQKARESCEKERK
jgi:hypothetical protein